MISLEPPTHLRNDNRIKVDRSIQLIFRSQDVNSGNTCSNPVNLFSAKSCSARVSRTELRRLPSRQSVSIPSLILPSVPYYQCFHCVRGHQSLYEHPRRRACFRSRRAKISSFCKQRTEQEKASFWFSINPFRIGSQVVLVPRAAHYLCAVSLYTSEETFGTDSVLD